MRCGGADVAPRAIYTHRMDTATVWNRSIRDASSRPATRSTGSRASARTSRRPAARRPRRPDDRDRRRRGRAVRRAAGRARDAAPPRARPPTSTASPAGPPPACAGRASPFADLLPRDHRAVAATAARRSRTSSSAASTATARSSPLEDALGDDVLIAEHLDGRPLDRDHGAPVRLVSPSQYGFISTKHLCRIELHSGEPTGIHAAHPVSRVVLHGPFIKAHPAGAGLGGGAAPRCPRPGCCDPSTGSPSPSACASAGRAGSLRLPDAAHTARPWRIHELTRDFRLEDVWALPTPGGPDDFPRLVRQVRLGRPVPLVLDRGSARSSRSGGGWGPCSAGTARGRHRSAIGCRQTLRDGPSGPSFDALPFTPRST